MKDTKTSNSTNPAEALAGVKSGLHFCAILDLQGQGKVLEGLEDELVEATKIDSDISNIQNRELLRRVCFAYAPVVTVPSKMREAFRLWSSTRGEPTKLSPEDEEQAHRALEIPEPLVALLGDAFLISAPLTAQNLPLVVWLATLQVAQLVLNMFKGGIATRGAMDMGQSVEFNDCGHQFYGAVLARVNRLESKVAEHPRVVVGERLVRYALERSRKEGSCPAEWAEPEASKMLLSLLTRDTDQQWILDYLGEGFRKLHAPGTDRGKSRERDVAKAYRFVATELARQRKAGDKKLTARYERLNSYFRSKAHLWPGMT
jgi:hypothetical protein